jgi:hypothetical protein
MVGITIPRVVNMVKNFSHPDTSGSFSLSKAPPSIFNALAALNAKFALATRISAQDCCLPLALSIVSLTVSLLVFTSLLA